MILVAGLSPAWQQILRFEGFRLGEVNRAAETHWCASGKAVNVAWALSALGAEVELISTVGGVAGSSLRRDVDAQGIRTHWIETAAATRVCTTVLTEARGTVTELVENAPAIEAVELANFVATYQRRVQEAELVVLTGSLPGGVSRDFYHELLQMTPCPALLDVRGDELAAALACRPLVVKPNREELEHTLGRRLETEAQLLEGMREIQAQGAGWVVVSQGADTLWAVGNKETLRISPPGVQAVNPIAAGDCLAAGIAWGIVRGESLPEALLLGVAAATENVEQMLPARLLPEAVLKRAATVGVSSV